MWRKPSCSPNRVDIHTLIAIKCTRTAGVRGVRILRLKAKVHGTSTALVP